MQKAATSQATKRGKSNRQAGFAIALDTKPMEAKTAASLPINNGPWQYEPKWDGFRCLAFKSLNNVELRAKSGKPLGRYFPEVVATLLRLQTPQFVLDGELVIETAGGLAFDALQSRLHPAESRIKKLAAAIPARLIVFDMLVDVNGTTLIPDTLENRRQRLEQFFCRNDAPNTLFLSPRTLNPQQAENWLRSSGYGATDGVVAKRLNESYQPDVRAMIKVKRLRTADCVVGGFRYANHSHEVGSLLLGLYNGEGKLDHVGFTSAIPNGERAALTTRLEALKEAPGFSGKAPGGPSRWSTQRSSEWQPVRPELVVEVRFDHVTGDRFRHGTKLMRWRPDKSPRQCRFDQIAEQLSPTA
jgi:ATP-dependent DNA ligase